MSEQEKDKLDYLVQKFDEHSSHVREELATIKRGVYGDPDNKVPGLMDRQLEDERRIKVIEDERKAEAVKKKTILWIGGSIVAAFQTLLAALYHLFFNKH